MIKTCLNCESSNLEYVKQQYYKCLDCLTLLMPSESAEEEYYGTQCKICNKLIIYYLDFDLEQESGINCSLCGEEIEKEEREEDEC